MDKDKRASQLKNPQRPPLNLGKPWNFESRLPLEDCRRNLLALNTKADARVAWTTEVSFSRMSGDAWRFKVVHNPKRPKASAPKGGIMTRDLPQSAPPPAAMSIEGTVRRLDDATVQVNSRVKSIFSPFDLNMNDVIVLLCLIVILVLGGELLGLAYNFGVVGLGLALAFLGYRWLEHRQRLQALLRRVETALGRK